MPPGGVTLAARRWWDADSFLCRYGMTREEAKSVSGLIGNSN